VGIVCSNWDWDKGPQGCSEQIHICLVISHSVQTGFRRQKDFVHVVNFLLSLLGYNQVALGLLWFLLFHVGCQSYQWPSCDISFAIALFIVQVGLWAQGGGTLTLMACVHLSLLHGHIIFGHKVTSSNSSCAYVGSDPAVAILVSLEWAKLQQ
jgi:ABC-type proline/glycine betaine transport system permease subunit